MNKRFIKVCDGVNLIVDPCKYKDFNLKPGMLLFDENKDLTGLYGLFVAIHETDSSELDCNENGRPSGVIRLWGYQLWENYEGNYQHCKAYIDIMPTCKDYVKILNAVDLAVGEGKLRNLFLTADDDRFTDNIIFSVYNSNCNFNTSFLHVIGNVYLQKFTSYGRDRLTTLSSVQVESFNNLSDYGVVQLGESDLSMSSDDGFQGFLRAYWCNDYGFYSSEDVVDTIVGIKDYYDKFSYDGCFEPIYDMNISCGCTLTVDGFNVKPFMIRITSDVAKDYLIKAVHTEGAIDYLDYYDYESLDNLIIDDDVHMVYLTSQCGHDSNYDFQNYGYSSIYNGYYYDGHSYVHSLFSVNDDISNDIYNVICLSMNECRFVEDNFKDLDNLDEVKLLIDDRLSDVADDFLDSKINVTASNLYSNYYRQRCNELSNEIDYPEITDSWFHVGSKSYELKSNSCDEEVDWCDVDF